MEQPTLQVKCHVSNCKYNQTNYCIAQKIDVAPQNGSFSNSSYDTVCSTFEPKNS
ncbi:DUF1540 domain-containing protein [Lutibacter sp. B2]|nr:DUF1540 domain-containing protein [Lutibacter sp. B2]